MSQFGRWNMDGQWVPSAYGRAAIERIRMGDSIGAEAEQEYRHRTWGTHGGHPAMIAAKQAAEAASRPLSARDRAIAEYRRAYEEGRAANLQRYEDILGGYRGREARAKELADQVGTTAKADIEEQNKNRLAEIRQMMVNAGLANSSVMPTLMNMQNRTRDRASMELADQLARTRMSAELGATKDTLDFQERRVDDYPSLQELLAMEAQAGEGNLEGMFAGGAGLGGGANLAGGAYGYGAEQIQRMMGGGRQPASSGNAGRAGVDYAAAFGPVNTQMRREIRRIRDDASRNRNLRLRAAAQRRMAARGMVGNAESAGQLADRLVWGA